jgi:hypothetical protein
MPRDEKEVINESSDVDERHEMYMRMHKGRGMPWMIGLLVIAGILFVAAVAAVTSNVFLRGESGFMFGRGNNTAIVERGDGFNHMNSGMMGFRNLRSINTTNANIVSGVVTSVNGGSFVLAGGGNQYTINTTGSTTYNTADKKVSVNDSIIVIGTITDKTVAATDVRIVNN